MSAMKRGEGRKVVAISIGLIAVAVPALLAWDFPGTLSASVSYAIVILGGALAGRLLAPSGERMRAHLVAMAGGAIAGLGAFATVTWWLGMRSSVYSAELLLVSLIGAAPGVVLGQLGYARVRRPDAPLPPATARDVR